MLTALLCLAAFVPSWAGEVGIIALPRDMDQLTVENYIEALDLNKQAGATVFLNAPRWSEMEASAGVFTLDSPLGGAIYAVERGSLKGLYFGLQLINTVKRELPPDLADTSWDDPVLLERLDSLLAAVKDRFKTPPLAVSVGNEVDVYFEQHPDELDSYIVFLRGAQRVFRKHFPDAPVGTTVTFDGLMKGRTKIIERLIEASDVVYFTYYPVIDLKPLPLADIPKHLDLMIKMAGGKRLILQEAGFPASVKLGLSEAEQAQFYKSILPLLLKSRKIEASFIFALHDISPRLCDSLMGYYGAVGWPQEIKEGFQSFLCTLGLRHSNGEPRPAYEAVKGILTGE